MTSEAKITLSLTIGTIFILLGLAYGFRVLGWHL